MADHPNSSTNLDNNASPNSSSFYDLLGVDREANATQIRQAYRQKSKHYHPDTTALEPKIAAEKFRALNQAYQTLSNLESRRQYDRKTFQARAMASSGDPRSVRNRTSAKRVSKNSLDRSAYLDAQDRPLSSGEIFALFILGLTFLACLVLALIVGVARGEVFLSDLPFNISNLRAISVLGSPPQERIAEVVVKNNNQQQLVNRPAKKEMTPWEKSLQSSQSLQKIPNS